MTNGRNDSGHCGVCDYFDPMDNERPLGQGWCRINAPCADADGYGVFPLVTGDEWCAEWREIAIVIKSVNK